MVRDHPIPSNLKSSSSPIFTTQTLDERIRMEKEQVIEAIGIDSCQIEKQEWRKRLFSHSMRILQKKIKIKMRKTSFSFT